MINHIFFDDIEGDSDFNDDMNDVDDFSVKSSNNDNDDANDNDNHNGADGTSESYRVEEECGEMVYVFYCFGDVCVLFFDHSGGAEAYRCLLVFL